MEQESPENLEIQKEIEINKELCQICGSENLWLEGRCTTCIDCGWSMCGI